MYCIYSAKEYSECEMSVEHIIPLSLGGCDDFTIMVEKRINSEVGSKIDGKLCNDFLLGLQQLPYDNKGHTKKSRIVKLRGMSPNGHAISWHLSKNKSKIYDCVNRKEYTGKMQLRTSVNLDIRWRFACKVALATGYYLFGKDFETYADCDTLRKVMLNSDDAGHLDLRVYTDLIKIKDTDKGLHDLLDLVFRHNKCSAVYFGYAVDRIIVSVALNGKFLAMVNFKADIDKLPLTIDLHRAGCMLMCSNNKLLTKSYWQCVSDFNDEMHIVDL